MDGPESYWVLTTYVVDLNGFAPPRCSLAAHGRAVTCFLHVTRSS